MGAWHRQYNIPYGIHPYYTLFLTKIQAKLAKTAFFVNYDDFYVNIFM